jgi:hypothetical protein
MAKKVFLWLAVLSALGVTLAALIAPAPAFAGGRAAPTPTITPTPPPLLIAKVGSNTHLVIGALVLVVIILIGVALNVWRKK